VHALQRLHAGLVSGGVIVDTQPVSAHPPVEAGGSHIGALDMQAWAETIAEVDARIAEVIADGLFTVEAESAFTVTDGFDDPAEFIDTVSAWMGTRIPSDLARRATAAAGPVDVHQEVRLRLLRRA
jgi:hypothetical protein